MGAVSAFGELLAANFQDRQELMSEVYMFSREELRRLIAVSVSTGIQLQANKTQKLTQELRAEMKVMHDKLAALQSRAEVCVKRVVALKLVA